MQALAVPRPAGDNRLLTWHRTGEQWFDAVLEGIARADASIDLEFYIWTPGCLTERLGAALTAAAARGCRVRLLLDAFGSEGSAPMRSVRHPGVQM